MEQPKTKAEDSGEERWLFGAPGSEDYALKCSFVRLTYLWASIPILLKALEYKTTETTMTAGGYWLPSPLEDRLHQASAK